jgi:hypothetical protein
MNMATAAEDKFEKYFTEKLWEMIPAIYRQQDGDPENPGAGVLRALVMTLAEQAAILRRSQDRLWDDQFIELCCDWAVPYIADLLGTRLVSAQNKRGRRIDVAKTIYYRRRKGTLRVLEELISDITGWEGTIIENFKRLGRCRHGLDPFPAGWSGPFTGSMPGGWADLRKQTGSELAYGPFEEYYHYADFRRHNGIDGHYNIPKLAVHLFRIISYRIEGVTPCIIKGMENQLTFDPSGRSIPLFIRRNRPPDWDEWHPAKEWELPVPLRCRLLALSINTKSSPAVLNASVITDTVMDKYSVAVYQGTGFADRNDIASGNLSDFNVVFPNGKTMIIDPERGRLYIRDTENAKKSLPTYHYGFSGPIGAGTYDRSYLNESKPNGKINNEFASSEFRNDGISQVNKSLCYYPVENKMYVEHVNLRAKKLQRPYICLNHDAWNKDWIFANNNSNIIDAGLIFEGIWLGNGLKTIAGGSNSPNIVIQGTFKCLIIKNCTIDPGGSTNCTFISDSEVNGKNNPVIAQIPPVHLVIEAKIDTLVIDSCITGPIYTNGDREIEKVIIRDSIIQSIDNDLPAIKLSGGKVEMERSTVFGSMKVHRLYASDSIITGTVDVFDTQNSCFRFSSATKEGSSLPRPYESHLHPGNPNHWFTSIRFGHPCFAQLTESAPMEITRGSETGSEMGAFCSLMNPIKLDSLKTKTDEYMPFGLIPIYINQT